VSEPIYLYTRESPIDNFSTEEIDYPALGWRTRGIAGLAKNSEGKFITLKQYIYYLLCQRILIKMSK